MLDKTVNYILDSFHALHIEYAVLRNYEELPFIGHDLDLVCLKKDLPEIEVVLANAAETMGWDCLVRSDHYRSVSKAGDISIYRFYSLTFNCYLQIDFFGGFPVMGICAISAEDFLKEKELYKKWYKISVRHEAVMRTLQLARAIQKGQRERAGKLKTWLGFTEKKCIDNYFKSVLGINGFTGGTVNEKAYVRNYTLFKQRFFLNAFLNNPFNVFFTALVRIKDYAFLFIFNQPGITIKIDQKTVFIGYLEAREILEEMVRSGFITHYHIIRKNNFGNILQSLRVKERGGVVVKFCRGCGHDNFSKQQVIESLIRNNILLFKRLNNDMLKRKTLIIS